MSLELQDRAEYAAYVDAQRAAISQHMGWEVASGGFDDYWRPQRHGVSARRRPDLELCKGPLHVAWPHLTEELQRAYEEGVFRWITWSEFRAYKVAERAAEADAHRDYVDSAEFALDQLEELRELLARRDELIAMARERGAESARVEEAAGMSRMSVHRARERALTAREVAADEAAGWGVEF